MLLCLSVSVQSVVAETRLRQSKQFSSSFKHGKVSLCLSSTYGRIIVRIKDCNFSVVVIQRQEVAGRPCRAHLLSATLRDRLITQRIQTIDNLADHVRHFRHFACSSCCDFIRCSSGRYATAFIRRATDSDKFEKPVQLLNTEKLCFV